MLHARGHHAGPYRSGPYAGEKMLNVLLTNDDGIEAEGLQAMRARSSALPGRAPGGDRPRRQPLGDGPLDHDAQAAVGRGGAVRRRHHRLRDRRHAGRLRAAREPRAGRGLRGRPRRVGDQPRRQPRRRHHLLGHRRRGARGRRARAAGDRRLPAVGRGRARLPLRRRLRLRRRGGLRRAAGRAHRGRAAAARGRCSTSTCPRGSPRASR